MKKKNNFNSSIIVGYPQSFDGEGFSSNEFGTSGKDTSTITYFWILSGQTPSPNIRGIWTDVGVWNSANTWLG